MKYRSPKGPSELIATPIVYEDRVYVSLGQDSEGGIGTGEGCMTCMGAGPDQKVGALWRFTGMKQTMSTASVGDGLVYVADARSGLYCLDAKTGQPVWTHDLQAGEVWGSTLLADGKVYVGTESGEVTILAAGAKRRSSARSTSAPASPPPPSPPTACCTSRRGRRCMR